MMKYYNKQNICLHYTQFYKSPLLVKLESIYYIVLSMGPALWVPLGQLVTKILSPVLKMK